MCSTTRRRFLIAAACLVALLAGSCEPPPPKRQLTGQAHQINNAAFWAGAVWFADTEGSIDEDDKTAVASWLVRLKAGAGHEIERIAPLDAVEPWLVAGQGCLWILSAGSVASYKDGKLATEKLPQPLSDVSRPFLYQGKPALIASRPPGYRLLVWEDGKWQARQKLRMRLPNESDECTGEYLRAFEHDGVVHVFCQVPFAAPVYYHRGLPLAEDEQNWQKVADAPGQWTPAQIGDYASLFFHTNRDGGPAVVGLRRRHGQWEDFFSRAIGLDMGLGICPTGKGEDFILLRRVFPLGTRILGVENARPVWAYQGEGKTNLIEVLTE